MKDEKDKLRELEKEKKQLESALAQEHSRNLSLEALIESIEEHYGIDVKKILATKCPKSLFTSPGTRVEILTASNLWSVRVNSPGIL